MRTRKTPGHRPARIRCPKGDLARGPGIALACTLNFALAILRLAVTMLFERRPACRMRLNQAIDLLLRVDDARPIHHHGPCHDLEWKTGWLIGGGGD